MEVDDINIVRFCILSVILFFGIPGNVMSFVVWTKGKNCSKSSSAIYFKLLAICDLLVLLIPGVDFFVYLFPKYNKDLRVINIFLCKFLTFASVYTRDISLGVTFALTIERTITVCRPFSAYNDNVRKRAYIIFTIITSLAFILNTPYLIVDEITDLKQNRNTTTAANTSESNSYKKCTYMREPVHVKEIIELYNTIHFSCHVIIPVLVLTFCNSLILRTLCKDKKQSAQRGANTIKKSIHTVSLLVICISIIHVLSTLPMSLRVISLYHEFNLNEFWTDFANLVIQNLLFLNSGINCVLYCFIGIEFRQDLRNLCKTCCARETLKEEHF
ncbi:galanin receptor type 1-like [Ruditapes philippinarum]|uniref:galanin receptor type 1-like n=1 Tax=Ruditapes philippinarum TaxID=129788 RepID=UPI00295BB65B|nr:galanin receptor type 1-like [Ruditapes philippinarum]